ncbi:hypothetical protein B5807_05007 [Epicoccum nigrum]|uniref:Uncharacterized protein n=1 Tax=Epicoccum nigrum TaxID=105696 RepID=A0A1Y2M4G6_EPING|nr:hypothetical protein B5807_05007 [Epicoccum nigrum]
MSKSKVLSCHRIVARTQGRTVTRASVKAPTPCSKCCSTSLHHSDQKAVIILVADCLNHNTIESIIFAYVLNHASRTRGLRIVRIVSELSFPHNVVYNDARARLT